MALDEESRQMRGTMAARTGQPVAVDDEDLVGDHLNRIETVEKILVVEPAYATAIAIEQPCFVEDEDAGAEADNRNACRCAILQEAQCFRRQGAVIADQSADNDDVVVVTGIAQPRIRLHFHAAARLHAAERCGEHRPFAEDGSGAVRLIGGKAQHVDEIREGRQREAVGKQEGDAEAFFWRRAIS